LAGASFLISAAGASALNKSLFSGSYFDRWFFGTNLSSRRVLSNRGFDCFCVRSNKNFGFNEILLGECFFSGDLFIGFLNKSLFGGCRRLRRPRGQRLVAEVHATQVHGASVRFTSVDGDDTTIRPATKSGVP
jgi:hypothetical protein